MTKSETQIIRKAIKNLLDDGGDFTEAIGELCKLVGYRYPPCEVKTKKVSIAEVIQNETCS